MGKATLLDKIKNIIWTYIEAPIFERILKRHNLDFGEFYMDELIKMYNKYKGTINRK